MKVRLKILENRDSYNTIGMAIVKPYQPLAPVDLSIIKFLSIPLKDITIKYFLLMKVKTSRSYNLHNPLGNF